MAYRFKHGEQPLEGFTVQRGVGRGGFGEVYYALSDSGREVALKHLQNNPEVELRGVSHCMNLKSPHLVQIFDVKRNQDGDYFIVMEYVSGPSLRDMLVSEPMGLGVAKTAFLIREIAGGLGYLHERGIVHRDMKPGNIFYEDGYVKIGDYGLSKFISTSRHSAQTSSVGTVHYMAPEVGSGNYSRGIDIYALGVMLYEMLMGKVPFAGSSMGEVLMKHLTEQPEVDQLPEPFGRVIRKALAKDPNERYQSVKEMMDELVGVGDIRNSLAEFDHSVLSMVPRRLPEEQVLPPLPQGRPWGEEGSSGAGVGRVPPLALPVTPGGGVAIGVAVGGIGRPQTPIPFQMPRAVPANELSAEAATGQLYFAGFWIRLAATLIDMIVVSAVAGLLMLPFGWRGEGNNPFFIVASILYSGLLIGRWNGQTLGKKACGIKVISADGRPCGQWQAFARALAEWLNMFSLGFTYLMVAFGEHKRGLHDRIAGTLHVYAVA